MFKIHEIISKKAKINRKIKIDTFLKEIENRKYDFIKKLNELESYKLTDKIDNDYLFDQLYKLLNLIFEYRYKNFNELKQDAVKVLEELRNANPIFENQGKYFR